VSLKSLSAASRKGDDEAIGDRMERFKRAMEGAQERRPPLWRRRFQSRSRRYAQPTRRLQSRSRGVRSAYPASPDCYPASPASYLASPAPYPASPRRYPVGTPALPGVSSLEMGGTLSVPGVSSMDPGGYASDTRRLQNRSREVRCQIRRLQHAAPGPGRVLRCRRAASPEICGRSTRSMRSPPLLHSEENAPENRGEDRRVDGSSPRCV
jgi:hypothetical protein